MSILVGHFYIFPSPINFVCHPFLSEWNHKSGTICINIGHLRSKGNKCIHAGWFILLKKKEHKPNRQKKFQKNYPPSFAIKKLDPKYAIIHIPLPDIIWLAQLGPGGRGGAYYILYSLWTFGRLSSKNYTIKWPELYKDDGGSWNTGRSHISSFKGRFECNL